MNWIIRKSKKLRIHTDLQDLLLPIEDNIIDFKWILSDLDFMGSSVPGLPINFEKDYFVLDYKDLKIIMDNNIQIIWGALIAVPRDVEVNFTNDSDIPFVEGNDNIWINNQFQFKDSLIEIDCFDSSFTIVKFKDNIVSKKFKDYFTEAIELDKFK